MCVSHCKCQLYLHVKINITYINIYIYDLHGPRHIQKTGPKLTAIELKLIAIPFQWYFFMIHKSPGCAKKTMPFGEADDPLIDL